MQFKISISSVASICLAWHMLMTGLLSAAAPENSAVKKAPAVRKTIGRPAPAAWNEGLPKEVLANPKSPALPKVYKEVNFGLAAKYPDDKGLENDKDVLFKVDFDNGTVPDTVSNAKWDDWCGVPWPSLAKVSKYEPVTGSYCASNSWDALDTGGSATRWRLGNLREFQESGQRPAFFIRLYHRFSPGWYGEGKVLGMKGFGILVQAVKHNANIPCDGKNWFASEMQWVGWGPSAKTQVYKGMCIHGHYYSYMPYSQDVQPMLSEELRPGGTRFSAYANQRTWVHLDEWYCYEVGLYMNTPGEADGEGRFWENGVLTTHIKNMRYADTLEAFKVYAQVQYYRTQHDNATTPVARFIDNVVVANRYIGPIKFSDKQLAHFVDKGIVVHTGAEHLTERMRKARERKTKFAVPSVGGKSPVGLGPRAATPGGK